MACLTIYNVRAYVVLGVVISSQVLCDENQRCTGKVSANPTEHETHFLFILFTPIGGFSYSPLKTCIMNFE